MTSRNPLPNTNSGDMRAKMEKNHGMLSSVSVVSLILFLSLKLKRSPRRKMLSRVLRRLYSQSQRKVLVQPLMEPKMQLNMTVLMIKEIFQLQDRMRLLNILLMEKLLHFLKKQTAKLQLLFRMTKIGFHWRL